MTKKRHVFVGIIALTIALLATVWMNIASADSPNATVIVAPSSSIVQPGQGVTVTVSYDQITDINTTDHQVMLFFNPDVLQVVSWQVCNLGAECFMENAFVLDDIQNDIGRVLISQSHMGVGTDRTSGLVVTLQMTVTAMGESDFVVSDADSYFIPRNEFGEEYSPHLFDVTQVQARPDVYLSSSTYNVDEDAGPATITATLETTSTLPVTVTLATVAGGSATPGSDYVSRTEQLIFGVGVTQTLFTLPITDDGELEGLETVNLELSAPQNADLGTPITAILNIIDDETAGVAVDAAVSALLDDPGATVTYTVRVTNTGTAIDSYDLAASGAWMPTVQASAGPLGSDAFEDVTVEVQSRSTRPAASAPSQR